MVAQWGSDRKHGLWGVMTMGTVEVCSWSSSTFQVQRVRTLSSYCRSTIQALQWRRNDVNLANTRSSDAAWRPLKTKRGIVPQLGGKEYLQNEINEDTILSHDVGGNGSGRHFPDLWRGRVHPVHHRPVLQAVYDVIIGNNTQFLWRRVRCQRFRRGVAYIIMI